MAQIPLPFPSPTRSDEPVASSSARPTWTCSVCTSELRCQAHGIGDSQVCAPCIRRLFELALADDMAWPPRWGREALNHWDFRHVLDGRILRRLEERSQEHGCPVPERVYCRQQYPPGRASECGAFIGRRSDDGPICKVCRRCGLFTCMRCLKRFAYVPSGGPETRIQHYCRASPEDNVVARQELDAAFRGLKRGRDYQECPQCRLRVQLADGCNHITCTCGEQFCYLCGRRATEASDHWDRRQGGCPRYGQPGDEQAMYSEEIAFADNELDSDSDAGHEDLVRYAVPRLLEIQERREFERQRQQDRLREHGRNYARELAENMNHQATLAEVYGDEELTNYHIIATSARRGAIDHGQPWARYHVREDEWPDNNSQRDHWQEGRVGPDARSGVRTVNRYDPAWRHVDPGRTRALQIERDRHRRLGPRALNSPASSPSAHRNTSHARFVGNLRRASDRRPLHHERSWLRARETARSESSDVSESSRGPVIESSRPASQRNAIGLRDSRRRRDNLRVRRRARDIVVHDDSYYDSLSERNEPDSLTSLRSFQQPQARSNSTGRVRSVDSSPRSARRRQSSTSEPASLSRRNRSQQEQRGLTRRTSQSSGPVDEAQEAEQEAFIRQHGHGRRLNEGRQPAPQRSVGSRVWRLIQAVGGAIF